MNRLTYRALDQNNKKTDKVWYNIMMIKPGECILPHTDKEKRVLEKLADYEDAEDQGRLVILPHDMAVSMNLVVAERERQIDLWGDQSGNHPYEWMAILGEEYGELCEAVNETCFRNPKHPERGGKPNIAKEAVHVAAVAIAIAEAAMKGEREDV